MLTQQELHGNWNEIKGRIQEMWGQLTDDQLTQSKGSVNQLVGMIQKQTGDAKEKIESYLDDIMHRDGAASQAAAAARQYARQTSDTAREYAEQASETAREHYDAATQAVQDGYENAEQLVRQRPAESIAVTFGAGLIVGTVVGLLCRSRA
ncbi:UNVERIFIED_CONTAM: hypothetical protein GTU68_025402 [Idotea baltica]|nr:hypothetical protein [Idotea baltica]